jgi:hypothetical protein
MSGYKDRWVFEGYQDALVDVLAKWREAGPEAALRWIEDNGVRGPQTSRDAKRLRVEIEQDWTATPEVAR